MNTIQHKTLPLRSIRADPAAQPRAAMQTEEVEGYIDAMARGADFPPLVVYFDGVDHWLADGFHRKQAAEALNLPDFPCEVHFGSLRSAILHSCGANASHGIRRTNEDKQRAVQKMLSDPEWSKWSNYDIGRHCAVDEKTVRNWRPDTTEIPQSDRKFMHPKSGREATMNVANIGKRPHVEVALPTPLPESVFHPDLAGFFEIERGMMALGTPREIGTKLNDDDLERLKTRIPAIIDWWQTLAGVMDRKARETA